MAEGSQGYGSGAADRNGHTGRTTLHCYGPGFYFAWGRECIHLEPKATGAVEGKSLDSAGRAAWQSPGSDPLQPLSGPLQVTSYGAITRSGYRIEKLIYESEPGIFVPSLLYVPDAGASKKAAVLMVTGDGKAASASEAEQFAASGTVVLSIDMRGTGETRVDTDVNSREFDHYFGDFNDTMTALLVGKTMAGMRALDISRGVDVLNSRKEVDANQVYGYGKD